MSPGWTVRSWLRGADLNRRPLDSQRTGVHARVLVFACCDVSLYPVRVGSEQGIVNNRHDANDSKGYINLTAPRPRCRVARSVFVVPGLLMVCGRQATTKLDHLLAGL